MSTITNTHKSVIPKVVDNNQADNTTKAVIARLAVSSKNKCNNQHIAAIIKIANILLV